MLLKLDTGAHVNILMEDNYRQLQQKPQIHETKETLKGYYNSGYIPVKGKCVTTVVHGARRTNMAFFVVQAQSLLDRASCEKWD